VPRGVHDFEPSAKMRGSDSCGAPISNEVYLKPNGYSGATLSHSAIPPFQRGVGFFSGCGNLLYPGAQDDAWISQKTLAHPRREKT
jgi:hypothetical protein